MSKEPFQLETEESKSGVLLKPTITTRGRIYAKRKTIKELTIKYLSDPGNSMVKKALNTAMAQLHFLHVKKAEESGNTGLAEFIGKTRIQQY